MSDRSGNVSLANSIGTGIADDKVVIPISCRNMIKYYLDQEPDLSERADLISASEEADRKYTPWSIWPDLVVKAANESGGYGMFDGAEVFQDEKFEMFRRKRSWPNRATTSRNRWFSSVAASDSIATARSKAGTWICGRSSCPGEHISIIPGGLTRVALAQGLDRRQLVARRRQQGHLGACMRTNKEIHPNIQHSTPNTQSKTVRVRHHLDVRC